MKHKITVTSETRVDVDAEELRRITALLVVSSPERPALLPISGATWQTKVTAVESRSSEDAHCSDCVWDRSEQKVCPKGGWGKIGGHNYNIHVTGITYACACSAVMGRNNSSAPDGADPFGRCPLENPGWVNKAKKYPIKYDQDNAITIRHVARQLVDAAVQQKHGALIETAEREFFYGIWGHTYDRLDAKFREDLLGLILCALQDALGRAEEVAATKERERLERAELDALLKANTRLTQLLEKHGYPKTEEKP